MSQNSTRILLTGIDAHSAASHGITPPGLDGDALEKELNESLAHVKEDSTIDMDVCWLYLEDDAPTDRLAERLRNSKPFDGIMVGWGVRGIPENSAFFEDCIEVMRKYSPASTKFLFSSTAGNHLETIKRSFP